MSKTVTWGRHVRDWFSEGLMNCYGSRRFTLIVSHPQKSHRPGVQKVVLLGLIPSVHCTFSKTEHDQGHNCSSDVPSKLQDKNRGQNL